MAADTKMDRATWIDSLNEALRDGRAWTGKDKEALYPDLEPPTQSRCLYVFKGYCLSILALDISNVLLLTLQCL